MVGHEVRLVDQVAADQFAVGAVSAQQPAAMAQDLPEQRRADRAQIDQIDRPAGAFGQGFDEGDLLLGADRGVVDEEQVAEVEEAALQTLKGVPAGCWATMVLLRNSKWASSRKK